MRIQLILAPHISKISSCAALAYETCYENEKGTRVMAENQSTASQTDEMTIYTDAARVSCNGGGGALGHPQVWLNMGADNTVTCPYCSRHFIQKTESA